MNQTFLFLFHMADFGFCVPVGNMMAIVVAMVVVKVVVNVVVKEVPTESPIK